MPNALPLAAIETTNTVIVAVLVGTVAVLIGICALFLFVWNRNKWLGALVAVVAYTVLGLLVSNAHLGCFGGSGTC